MIRITHPAKPHKVDVLLKGLLDLAPGVWTTAQVAAVVNYNAIREDKSLGFHYQNYVEAVLTNTIEAVTPPAP
jgi:hypothetical protein